MSGRREGKDGKGVGLGERRCQGKEGECLWEGLGS